MISLNIYFLGILIGISIYLLIGFYAGRLVKNLDDYYVSGHNANTVLITGTIFASMLSTNGFMGDVAYAYTGHLTTLLIINTLCACGYILGPLYFGRFIRRVKALTMPSYFGERYNSRTLQRIAGIIVVVSLSAYLLSVIQGTGLLMASLTGADRFTCLFIAWLSILAFTLWSGSRGVVLVDTAMCICFLLSTLLVGYYVFAEVGGITNVVPSLINNKNIPEGLLSYHGNLDGGSIFEALAYAITLGIVWMITVAVSPWQAGRNLMAKSEHVIFRSGILSAILTVFFLLYLYLIAVTIINMDPQLEVPEQVIIWATYNLVPPLAGVFLLTGILSAGLSSATTFLSVVGFSFANDICNIKFKSEQQQINFTRLVILVISLIAFVIAYFELASIRIIAWFASTIIAASWGFIAFASVWSKRINKYGAMAAMLSGFIGYLVFKALQSFQILKIPAWLDPFFIGVFMSVVMGIVFSILYKTTEEELVYFYELHKIPLTEQIPSKYNHSLQYGNLLIVSGILLTIILIYYWVIPLHRIEGLI